MIEFFSHDSIRYFFSRVQRFYNLLGSLFFFFDLPKSQKKKKKNDFIRRVEKMYAQYREKCATTVSIFPCTRP